jgi:hypothetical protein
MNAPDQPHHMLHDVATGATTYVLLTERELAEDAARSAAAARTAEEAQKEREDLRAAVEAHDDPVVKALAKLAGLA